ncbi:MAG: hypothetical protein IJD35_08715, partial [Clostridia bacterium]|nr:hypothetical protein [Clostridia bacterium]
MSKKERKSCDFAQINLEILASFNNNKSVEFFEKKLKKFLKKVLTKGKQRAIITHVAARSAIWGHSSAGRASALQAEGHRFEP